MQQPIRAPVGAATSHGGRDVSIDRLRSGALLVRVSGALDGRSGLELESRLRACMGERAGPPHVLLNLSEVGYLDRAGLSCLLRLQRDIAAADGGIELLAPSPAVIRMVHEADLHGASFLAPDRAAAPDE